jgi:hypothetical protein
MHYGKNLITSLEDDNGILVQEHSTKEKLIWTAFKERLGVSSFSEIGFNLEYLLDNSTDLTDLCSPFSKPEIDQVVKTLPSDKAPGPDGFNSDFVKKCWPVICQDFYNLCNAFFDGDVCLQSINGSLITLVPKHDNAIRVADYKPISLLNASVKILTKILANRLQQCLPSIIHRNQYGFIKARSIQDFLVWSLEYAHQCHLSRKEIIILKLDFEKAFDKVEHQLMLQIMQHKGFPGKWLQWMQLIFNSGSSAVLLNGIPGKTFQLREEFDRVILYHPCFSFWQLIFCRLCSIQQKTEDSLFCQCQLLTKMTSQFYSMQMIL